jgi:hypothetical protein
MGTSKTKKGKPRGGTPQKRTPLWVRDLMNILGGLVVGALVAWIVQSYLDGREAKGVSIRFAEDVERAGSSLKPFAERSLALSEGRYEGSDSLQGLDIAGPVHPLDLYRSSKADLPALHQRGLVDLLRFYESMDKAELYRKLLLEQREHPDQMPAILSREFLRALEEGAEMTSRVLWEIRQQRKK